MQKKLFAGFLFLASLNLYAFTCSTIQMSSKNILETKTQMDGISPIFHLNGTNNEAIMVIMSDMFGYRPQISVFVNGEIIATASKDRIVSSDESYNLNLKLYKLNLEIDCK